MLIPTQHDVPVLCDLETREEPGRLVSNWSKDRAECGRTGRFSGKGGLSPLSALIRRVLATRIRDPDVLDELVQEALTRLVEAHPRFAPDAIAAYAVVTARNLARMHVRSEIRRRRGIHRLADLRTPETPEEQALREEEKEAIGAALTRLTADDREALVDHELWGVDTHRLAKRMSATPGAVTARLARSRARLRVEFLIALQRREPPTPQCRPVLFALSAGDRRRQERLKAAAHLLDCSYCPALAESLLERRVPLVVLWPAAILSSMACRLRRWATKRPAHTVAVTAGALATGALLLLWMNRSPPRPCDGSIAEGTLRSGDTPLTSSRALAQFADATVTACGVTVESVPANEGFWIGSRDQRVWVQIVTGGESRVQVRPGQMVSFRGRVQHHDGQFPQQVGVDTSEGAVELRQGSHHIEVAEAELRAK